MEPVTSGRSENSWNIFLRKASDDCWAAWGPGSKIDVSAAVESENILNSVMSGSPSIISRMSLEACVNAIISASWLPALLASGTLWVKTVRPAWMPVTAQPAALGVLEPSVMTTRVRRPSRVVIQILCSAMSDILSFLPHACGLIFRRPRKGRDESW